MKRVSIHAPTRGATILTNRWRRSGIGFNPRAHTGRDIIGTKQTVRYESFNPRAHTGRDKSFTVRTNLLWVSIHAPTRGATFTLVESATVIRMFQSTRPHGARHNELRRLGYDSKFQSTRPHGARRFAHGRNLSKFLVSIHAPTRGATNRTFLYLQAYQFKSTSPHGARRSY